MTNRKEKIVPRPISIPRGRVLTTDMNRLKCTKCGSIRFYICYRSTDNMIVYYCSKCGKRYKVRILINNMQR